MFLVLLATYILDCQNRCVLFRARPQQCDIPVLPRIRATLSWNSVPCNPYDNPARCRKLSSLPQQTPTLWCTRSPTHTRQSTCTFADRCGPDQEVFSIGHTESTDVQANAIPKVHFEEFTCLGLDRGQSSLVAPVRVKQSRSYSAKIIILNTSPFEQTGTIPVPEYLGTTYTTPQHGIGVLLVDVGNLSTPCNQTKIPYVRAALACKKKTPAFQKGIII